MRTRLLTLCIVSSLAAVADTSFGQGFVLTGVGPVNRSMGGVATAAPVDATGAIQWNPAAISGLPASRVDIGVDLVYNRNRVNSGVALGTPGQITGSTDSNSGVSPLPAIGLVYKPDASPWTYGLGLNTVGGFMVNFPASTSNPIFIPPGAGGVIGQSYSRLAVLQVAPTIAYELSEGLSFGVAPTINMVDAQASPFPFAAPNAGGFPQAVGNRPVWGLGIQAGLFYQSQSGINLGASIKSPQWFERFEWNSTDDAGLPRDVSSQLEFPMIVSLGAAYAGIEHVLLGVDVRYVDFDSTQGFGEPTTITPNGLTGLGWESVILVAFGAQVEVTDRLTLRAGYSYHDNPIREMDTMFNILAPAPYQHLLSLGGSCQLTDAIIANFGWVHAFDKTINGPIIGPAGPVPLSNVGLSQETDSFLLGLSVLF
ncbi:MAG: hypothetical protein DWQ29_10330 [Planctomycetota bacterium]|nr:MAG: hypothetical protein DWQ29_10330 [Planctomycetota bacterium]